ncbi:TetR family transcriptional regulator [Streptomyces sp. ISL-10]|uniref:ScbR family autoregulator-binding transcription factor n=1 Tax=Streptomyces sp. ISL-10 TaxID=2819172 RepID=UPI001BED1ABE|nr:ScbR family autoregulator-binding transcription factor [Streptomyces sp. ISL-10]MBT2369079.1 TetR family transcriptional regulator [Streptomyces sp. ISL-10]
MAKQERAEQTRRSLIRAAALTFDDVGYERSSLTRISDAAGVSKGALSFHFSSKDELADAVQESAHLAARAVVDSVRRRSGPALQSVIDITHELAVLLETDPVARAGARLGRERAATADLPRHWNVAWAEPVRRLLHHARADGSLLAGTNVHTVAVLVAYLMSGLETTVRDRGVLAELVPQREPDDLPEPPRAWLSRIWELVLPEVAAAGHLALLVAEGSRGRGVLCPLGHTVTEP